MVGRTNAGGGGSNKTPSFTYSGTYSLIPDGHNDWRIKFLTSGTLKFTDFGKGGGLVDCFVVGGGGGDAYYINSSSGNVNSCGGGGYTNLVLNTQLNLANTFTITIGAGGSYASGSYETRPTGGTGGTSSITGGSISLSAAGGRGGYAAENCSSGAGGSGGGINGSGGTDGGVGTNGHGRSGSLGAGMGTYSATGIYYVREFRESSGDIYSNGGGTNISTTIANTGNGGSSSAVSAATGVVILRNHRS